MTANPLELRVIPPQSTTTINNLQEDHQRVLKSTVLHYARQYAWYDEKISVGKINCINVHRITFDIVASAAEFPSSVSKPISR